MDQRTERVKRVVLWGLAVWLWLPVLGVVATAITYILWMLMGKEW